MVMDERVWRVGDECHLRFGRMKPVLARISSIQAELLEFLPRNASESIKIGSQAFEIRIVSLSNE
jgi:hypothetical protein